MIDEEILAFVRRWIPSLWTLELLMLMQAEPTRAWSINELDRELRASDTIVKGSLSALIEAELVCTAGAGKYIYSPQSTSSAELVQKVAQAYHDRRIALIEAISSSSAGRIRALADAFLFKKPPS